MKLLSLLLVLFSSISMATSPATFWPVRYDERGLPLIDVQIVSRLHTLMLDTGSEEGLHLYDFNINKLIANSEIKAVQQAPHRTTDVSGNKSEVSAWKINQLLISSIPFYDVETVSFKPWGLSMGSEQPVNEVMGLGLFDGHRVLMDFKNDRLQVLDHLPSDIRHWSTYPLEKTASGLRIKASLEKTPLSLIVDTAASHSLLFSDRLPSGTLLSGCRILEPEASDLDCSVAKFSVTDNEGKLRDNLAIVTSDATPRELDFDGLLGMKFMRGHRVIIDMPERMLYIDR